MTIIKHLPEAKRLALRIDRILAGWGPLLLVLLAVGYYGAYVNSGLNLGGEGGTTAVIAMRLMEGQRPIVDTFLGYNVLWFYPITWLFQITGPDYLAMRVFFFAVCLATALLAFLTVKKITGSGIIALGIGVMLVLIPGMLFRNYMGLMAVANQWALVTAFLLPVAGFRQRVLLIGMTGLVLGLTYLVRIEVGLFMTVIVSGLLILNLFKPGRSWVTGAKESFVGGLLALFALVLVHLPFAWDAHNRGYAPQFYGQYTAFVGLMKWELQQQLEPKVSKPAQPAEPTAATEDSITQEAPATATPEAGSRRQRPELGEVLSAPKSRDRYFAAAIYVPVFLSLAMVIVASLALLTAWVRKLEEPWTSSLIVLVLTGCALTLFPQYYFFRPDTPHISEFMVPFLPAVIVTTFLLLQSAKRPVGMVVGFVGLVACVLLIVIHFGHAWPKESAGTIAARKHGPSDFVGLNNVRVKLRPANAEALAGLHAAIVSNSSPKDWVVCFPYSPTINFMTDRPSYLWDLYTDNTMAGPDFDSFHIALLRRNQPAAVVIDHRAINNNEASRFPNWAPLFYAYLKENFRFGGEFLGNEVFLRKESPQP